MVSAGSCSALWSLSGHGCEVNGPPVPLGYAAGVCRCMIVGADEQTRLLWDGLFMENNDRFQELEEKLLKVAEAFKQTREEKQAREDELDKLRKASQEESQQVSEKEREIQALKVDLQRIPALERELQGLRREREDVRARVEKMIRQIDALTKTEALG